MTELPRDPHHDDDPGEDRAPDRGEDAHEVADGLSDDTRDELRRLLRDEPEIDPSVRERNLTAALAAAVEPPLQLDPALPRPQPVAAPAHVLPRTPASSVTHLDRRRAGRMRVLAIAAAVVVVVGGLAAVNWGQGLTSSSSSGEETADAGKAVTDHADADAQGGADGSNADSSATAAAPEASASERADEASTTTIAGSGQFATGDGLVSLGSFDDLGQLFDAAEGLAAAGGSSPAATDSSAIAGPCVDSLAPMRVDAAATATFRDTPVLVVRATDPTGRTSTVVLSSPGCAVLAQG